MREIKFRAWNVKYKEMWDVNGLSWVIDKHYDEPERDVSSMIQSITSGNRASENPANNVILMQYTSLSDKNGTDIYDGDIVEYIDGEFSFKAVIKWAGWNWYMEGIDVNDNFNFEDTLPQEIEVIGNIYENPELVK